MGNINTVGPNEACVVSGGWCGSGSKTYNVGGWAWSWWFVSNVERISLNVLTIKPRCESVETSKGVPLSVTGVAQVKVMFTKQDKKLLHRACEHFIGRTNAEIEDILRQTLEGHLRAILGQLTVEEIYKDREQFAQQVRETATPDVGKMGIQILSFVIQDIRDDVEYLSSIGKAQTASVVKDATVGSTNAERDAKIKEAECDQIINDAKMTSETNIDNAKKSWETTKAKCDTLIKAAATDAKLAYDLQEAKEKQIIREAELEVQVIQRRKAIDVEKAEVVRRGKELEATQRLPAAYNAQRIEVIAEGERQAKVLIAESEAQKIRLIGAAEAKAIEATGGAEAQAMQLKAEAMQAYGRQAMVQMVLESLPALAAEVSAPLSKIDEIVLLGGGNDSASMEIGKLLSQAPPLVEALTGVDLSKVVANIPGAR